MNRRRDDSVLLQLSKLSSKDAAELVRALPEDQKGWFRDAARQIKPIKYYDVSTIDLEIALKAVLWWKEQKENKDG